MRLALLLLAALSAPPANFDPTAAAALSELAAACREEGGRLWGVELCGPTVIVDPGSRRAVANQADGEGRLEPTGTVFAGTLPDAIGLANTAFDWAGTRWSMVLWPLPAEKTDRLSLLLHEAWHRIQPELGFAAPMVGNDHLAQAAGRTWLRLEWRALRRALENTADARERAARDALVFRAHRHALFPAAAAEETALELNEGLAAYTGAASRGPAAAATIAEKLAGAESQTDFARSFAYLTGPAWGLLLDELAPEWRRELKAEHGPDALAAAALELPWPSTPDPGEVERRARAYDLDTVAAQEAERERQARAEIDRLRRTLVEEPALVLPLAAMQMQFDPNSVVPLPPHGTVYRTLTLQDRWGEVRITGGGLLASDFTQLSLPGPARLENGTLAGEGWTLTLAAGWRAVASEGRWELLPPADG